jgi:hypothetical protein
MYTAEADHDAKWSDARPRTPNDSQVCSAEHSMQVRSKRCRRKLEEPQEGADLVVLGDEDGVPRPQRAHQRHKLLRRPARRGALKRSLSVQAQHAVSDGAKTE